MNAPRPRALLPALAGLASHRCRMLTVRRSGPGTDHPADAGTVRRRRTVRRDPRRSRRRRRRPRSVTGVTSPSTPPSSPSPHRRPRPRPWLVRAYYVLDGAVRCRGPRADASGRPEDDGRRPARPWRRSSTPDPIRERTRQLSTAIPSGTQAARDLDQERGRDRRPVERVRVGRRQRLGRSTGSARSSTR